jgi:hypothetical protein
MGEDEYRVPRDRVAISVTTSCRLRGRVRTKSWSDEAVAKGGSRSRPIEFVVKIADDVVGWRRTGLLLRVGRCGYVYEGTTAAACAAKRRMTKAYESWEKAGGFMQVRAVS